eukprot:2071915-Lingulodinium_polyedra.AAC.1
MQPAVDNALDRRYFIVDCISTTEFAACGAQHKVHPILRLGRIAQYSLCSSLAWRVECNRARVTV